MNYQLGLRALALLAFVAASTVVIIKAELNGGSSALNMVRVIGHA